MQKPKSRNVSRLETSQTDQLSTKSKSVPRDREAEKSFITHVIKHRGEGLADLLSIKSEFR